MKNENYQSKIKLQPEKKTEKPQVDISNKYTKSKLRFQSFYWC